MRETGNTLQHQNSQQPKQFRGGEKKVMKKSLVSAALAASLVIPAAVPAFAATTPSDVVGTDVQSAVEELTALGIIEGYEDGTFKPENSITRAELAKIIVIATGYGSSANAMANTAPVFSDVKVSEWYTGYINVAAAKGYIQGYNGKYRPNDTVKFEEVVAILVRALGYQESHLSGTWPYNYIIAGQDADLFDDVTVATGSAADRGTVAQLTSNALDSYLVEYDEDGNQQYDLDEDDEKQKLINKLGKTEDHVLTAATLDDGDISLDGKDRKTADNFVVSGGYELVDLVGREVTVLINDDDEIFAVTDNQDEDLILEVEFEGTQAVDTIFDNEYVKIDDDGDKETYDVNDKKTYVFYNGDKLSNTSSQEFEDEDDVTLYLAEDEDGDEYVQAIVVSSWDEDQIVDEVTNDDDEYTIETKYGDDYTLTDDTVVTLNGVVADVEDLEEYDVINVLLNDEDEAVKVEATRKSISGELEEFSEDDGDYYFTVGGKEYEVVGDNYGDIDLDDDNIGSEYTYYLNADGDIAAVDGDAVDNSDFGVITSVTKGTYLVDGTVESNAYKVKYYSIADDEFVSEYTTDDRFTQFNLTEVFYNDDDILDYDGEDDDENPVDVALKSREVDSVSGSTVKLTNGSKYTVNSNTLYFNVDADLDSSNNITDIDDIEPADADDLTANDIVAVYAQSGTTATYVFILDDNNGDDLDDVQGLFVSTSHKYTSGDEHWYVKLAVNNKEASYEIDEDSYDFLNKKADDNYVVKLVDGHGEYEVVEDELYSGVTDGVVGTDEDDYNDFVTVDGEEYLVTDNTQFYVINDEGDYEKGSLAKLKSAIKDLALTTPKTYEGILVVPGLSEDYNEAGVIVIYEIQD